MERCGKWHDIDLTINTVALSREGLGLSLPMPRPRKGAGWRWGKGAGRRTAKLDAPGRGSFSRHPGLAKDLAFNH